MNPSYPGCEITRYLWVRLISWVRARTSWSRWSLRSLRSWKIAVLRGVTDPPHEQRPGQSPLHPEHRTCLRGSFRALSVRKEGRHLPDVLASIEEPPSEGGSVVPEPSIPQHVRCRADPPTSPPRRASSVVHKLTHPDRARDHRAPQSPASSVQSTPTTTPILASSPGRL